mmetsp:Transcript_6386/g.12746  ORF Transcript_6386/g.12746 Transcript_6386/m.12746 type:complete len:98 (-) Transcript_6386:2764-3057(-)
MNWVPSELCFMIMFATACDKLEQRREESVFIQQRGSFRTQERSIANLSVRCVQVGINLVEQVERSRVQALDGEYERERNDALLPPTQLLEQINVTTS